MVSHYYGNTKKCKICNCRVSKLRGIKMIEIQEIWLYIVAALGGGSVITACVIKKCATFLSDVFLKNIESKYEKNVEKYKAQLEQETNRLNALSGEIMHIAETQYDKEFDIYLNIWKALTECRKGLNAIIKKLEIDRPAYSYDEQRDSIEDCIMQYSLKYYSYENEVDQFAPFYRKDFYDILVEIGIYFNDIVCGLNGINGEDIIALNNAVTYAKEKKTLIDNNSRMLEEGIRIYLQQLRKM